MSDTEASQNTEIRFYHLQKQTLDQALPLIIEKAYGTGQKIVIQCPDEKETKRLNSHLWSYKPSSFLPHGMASDKNANQQPICLTHKDNNPNDAKVLILTQGKNIEDANQYNLCCEMLNGNDPESVSAARARWKTYKENGYILTYWMQSESGAWTKKG